LVSLSLFILVAAFEFFGIFVVSDSRGGGQNSRVRADLNAYKIALNLFHHDHGRYPTTEEGLETLSRKRDRLEPENHFPYVKKTRLDPWGLPYNYVNPPKHQAGFPDIFSNGEDYTAGTDDDIGNWHGISR